MGQWLPLADMHQQAQALASTETSIQEAHFKSEQAQAAAAQAQLMAEQASHSAQATLLALQNLQDAVERSQDAMERKMDALLAAVNQLNVADGDQAMQIAIQTAKLNARIHNVQQTGTSPLKPLPNDSGSVPLNFPSSPQAFGDRLYGGMVDSDYQSLLEFYNLSVDGDINELRQRLAAHCCVRLTRYQAVKFPLNVSGTKSEGALKDVPASPPQATP